MLSIREVMKSNVVSVRPETPVKEAISKLVEFKISGMPVVDADNTLVGVISEKDILRMFYEKHDTVGELMTPNPQKVAVGDDLVEVIDMLMASNFRRVLIHEAGKLVGLVSRADLMPALLEGMFDE